MTWGRAWDFGSLKFSPSLTVSAPAIRVDATAIGLPNVVLTITRAATPGLTTMISAAVATGAPRCTLRAGINARARAIGVAARSNGMLFTPPPFAVTAIGVPAVSLLPNIIPDPETIPGSRRDEWLAQVIALLDDVVANQKVAVDLVTVLENIQFAIGDLPTIVNDLYTLRNMALTNIRRQEMARSLSKLSVNVSGTSGSLSLLSGQLGAASTASLDDVDELRTLMGGIPDDGTVDTRPITTFLYPAATAIGVPFATAAYIPKPPTAYFVAAAATATGAVNVSVSVIRVATPSSYAVAAPCIVRASANETHTVIRAAAAAVVHQRSFAATAVGRADEAHTKLSADTSYPLKYFGFPWLSGSLAQDTVKGAAGGAAYTFRAPRTGTIKGFRYFLACETHSINGVPQNNGNSYGFGTGGTIRAHMETNNGTSNVPSGTWVGGTSNYDEMIKPKSSDTPWTQHDSSRNSRDNGYPYMTFPTPCAVTKGGIYHLVFKNVDANSTVNWASPDLQDTHNPGNPSLPFGTDLDWGALHLSGGNWVKRANGYYPICQIEYTDGFQWGCASDDNWNGYYVGTQEDIRFAVTPTAWVREKAFQPPQNVTVTHINICAGLVSGSGTLIVEILDTNDTVLRSVAYPSSTLPTDKDAWAGLKPILGATVPIATPIQFLANTQYRLRYRSSGGSYSVYNFTRTANSLGWRMPVGQANNYVDPGWINNTRVGWAQRSTNQNSGWVDFNGARESHLVFYFVPQ